MPKGKRKGGRPNVEFYPVDIGFYHNRPVRVLALKATHTTFSEPVALIKEWGKAFPGVGWVPSRDIEDA